MTVEVAVVGSPFVDLVFEGLPRIPGPGEEVVGRGFRIVPGGTAIQAIGVARLGVSAALVSPVGSDVGGRAIAEVLEAEGVRWIGEPAPATPATAVLTSPEGTAMATATTGGEVSADDVAAAGADLVVLSLGRTHLCPTETPACLVSGSIEIERGVEVPTRSGAEADTIVVNAREAAALTGHDDPEGAARALARGRRTAVVTLGAEGAIGVQDDRPVRAPAPRVDVADATGAGDLFVSAFVWSQRRGLELEAGLAWSCLAASLSVRSTTALDGACRLDDLIREGSARGLSPP